MLTGASIVNIFGYFTPLKMKKDERVEVGSYEYGSKNTIYSLPNLAANSVDKLIIGSFIGLEELAYFALAERISEVLKTAIQSVAILKTPTYAKSRFDVSIKRDIVRKTMAISLLLVEGTYFIAPIIGPIVFGSLYV